MPLDPYLSFFIATMLSLAGILHVTRMARREQRARRGVMKHPRTSHAVRRKLHA